MKGRLLWIGDAACGSGFGKATRHITRELAKNWDLTCIGVNYRGDPHKEPYDIWPAWPGGDPIGLGQLRKLYPEIVPHAVVVQTNPWYIPQYAKVLERFDVKPKLVGIIAVEGKNCVGKDLNKLDKAIFWTRFGAEEAVIGGMECPYGVVPLGVDLGYYKPGDRREARLKLKLPERCMDSFIVTNVNRNQNRKRPDLSVQFFAEFVRRTGADAYLFMHSVPGSSTLCDLDQLAAYYNVQHRLISPTFKDAFTGVPEEYVLATYQASDIHINTGLGEGWGLTTMESMACGIPNVATDYAAIPEWSDGAVMLVPPCSEGLMPDVHTMIGGTPDAEKFIDAIYRLWSNPGLRGVYSRASLDLVSRPEFRWERIAAGFRAHIEEVFA